ncbi:MAG: hypothetical protein V1716_03225 [Candidatus Uhrbacteria bacterium]
MKRYLILSLILGSFFLQPFVPVSAASENGGFVDVFERSAGSSFYEIKGWAYNPTAPSDEVAVDIYVNGVRVASVETSSYRSDVAAYLGVSRSFGFEYELPTNVFTCQFGCPATDEIQLTARDIKTNLQYMLVGGIQLIEHSSIGLFGVIDSFSEENPQRPQLFVKGWVASTDFPGTSYDIYVMAEGKLVGTSNSDSLSRTDVKTIYELPSDKVGYVVVIDRSLIESSSGAVFFVFAYDNNNNRFERVASDWYSF